MKIRIKETGEVKELTVIDRKTGVDWTADLVGDDDQIAWNDELGVSETTQDAYDWWAAYIADYTADEEMIEVLFEEIYSKHEYQLAANIEQEFMFAIADNDFERHHYAKQDAIKDIRARYL